MAVLPTWTWQGAVELGPFNGSGYAPLIYSGTGAPTTNSIRGSMYLRVDGLPGNQLYVKTTDSSGAPNGTGWVLLSDQTVTTVTSTYTAGATDNTILGNGTFTVTLPTTGIAVGKVYCIKNTGSGTITVFSSVNIDGSTSVILSIQYSNVSMQWDGTQWWTISTSSTSGVQQQIVSFSATPTFAPTAAISTQVITLTGNVTSSTLNITNISAGSLITFRIIQDGTGGRTFVWPSKCLNATDIGINPGQTTHQMFSFDGTNLYAVTPGTYL